MKKIIALLLSLALIMPVLAISPDSTPSIICLDRKYNFLDNDNYIAIASGNQHVALISDDNSLWTFGLNRDGQLGIGDTRRAYNAPVKVMENVSRVKTHEKTTIAIKNDGTAWAFGYFSESTPTKIRSNVKDADLFGITAYVDKGGNAGYIDYDGEEHSLCSGAKEIHILDNSTGRGLSGSDPSSMGALSMQDILNANNFYIVVIKENGDLYEYGIDRYGNAEEGRLVIMAVESVVTDGASITIIQNTGRVFTGSTSRGISPVNDINTTAYRNGYYLKDGYLVQGAGIAPHPIGRDVKLFAPVGGGNGIFMVHNDNSVSIYNCTTTEDYSARLQAINFSPVTMGRNVYYESAVSPIWAKAHELCGAETDLYKNAKTISDWIGKNIETYADYSGYGTKAFETGRGTVMAVSDLTNIMFTEMEIPCFIAENDNYAWNLAIIDGVTTFIDNSINDSGEGFDMGMFETAVSDSSELTSKYHSDYTRTAYDSWAATEVRGAYDYDLIDTFMGDKYTAAITRKNFCTLIRATIEKAKGKDIDAVIAEMGKSGVSVPFTDCTDKDVAAMCKLGIVGGTTPTTFEPARNITRQEAAKIITGLAKTLGADVSAPASSFADNAKISAWAKPYVDFVNYNGIMKGKTNGFDPLNSISIQESILICYRYLGNVIG